MAEMSESRIIRFLIVALCGVLVGFLPSFGMQLECGSVFANPGDTVAVTLYLTGSENVGGFQFLTPETGADFQVVDVRINDQILRADVWRIATGCLVNGTMKVIGYDEHLAGLGGGSYKLLDLLVAVDADVMPGVYPIAPGGVVICDPFGEIVPTETAYGYLMIRECDVQFSVQNDTLNLADQTQRVSILMYTWSPVAGFQFDILDSADIFRGLSCQHSFGDNWDVNCVEMENGAARVLALATDGVPLPDSVEYALDMEIEINPEVQPGPYPVSIENLVVSDENAGSLCGEAQGGVVFIDSTFVFTQERPIPEPAEYALYPNYPNPFNAQTTIRFDLPKTAEVTLTVCNLLGQEVIRLADDRYPAGEYRLRWEGQNRFGQPVESGIYFVILHAGDNFQMRKMILLK